MITARSKDQSFQDTSDAKVLRAKSRFILFHTDLGYGMLFVYEKCEVLSCHCLRDRSSVLLKANCCRLLMFVLLYLENRKTLI